MTDAIEDWHATQPPDIPPPVIIEHPINPELQTGASQLLGGAMQIKAPWIDDDEHRTNHP